ncbi:hypothetical protein Acr_19g0010070 [Actinidia rufa]|uniref:Transducin/WD40 repeat-like superfamily protein n=1 Tax=Actinidia rufa TaxID=165716 RepID=A0A7J0GBA7_9ERIC|nr:hypothetical protein Acr_19g0010070 [Actinidia rufa]
MNGSHHKPHNLQTRPNVHNQCHHQPTYKLQQSCKQYRGGCRNLTKMIPELKFNRLQPILLFRFFGLKDEVERCYRTLMAGLFKYKMVPSAKPIYKNQKHQTLKSSTMEFYEKQNLWSFIDEEKKNINLPRRFSFDNHEPDPCSARASSASTTSYPLWPTSPETPWTLSPVRTSPTSALLYHCLASLHRHEGNIFSITVERDFIFTGSESSRIYAWKQPDCADMGYIKTNAGEVQAILAHGRVLFTTHGDRKIRVWDVALKENFRPKKITTLPRRSSFFLYPRKNSHQHKDSISCIAYNYTDKLLYTGSRDKTVKAWKVSERKCIDSFMAHERPVSAIVIDQIDGCVFTCSSDGTVKIWRRVFGESSHILTMTLKFQPSPVNALALSSSLSGCFLYSGSSDGLINFWEKEKMSSRFNHGGFLQGHHFSVLCLVTVGT